MSEPRRAYIATSITPDEVVKRGGVGNSGRGYTTSTTMHLNPTEAIRNAFEEFGKFCGDDAEVFIYEVDLTILDGVWPRVRYQQYNGYELQWTARYEGKIPVEALTWLNHITKARFADANRVAL